MGDQFSNGQMGFLTGLGMLFSTAPWIDLSVLGITHQCPDTTHPLGHLVRLAIKRSLCMCAPFPFLGFIWIAWICSLGGPGDNFYSYQVFVLLCGALLAITCVPRNMVTAKILMPYLSYSCR